MPAVVRIHKGASFLVSLVFFSLFYLLLSRFTPPNIRLRHVPKEGSTWRQVQKPGIRLPPSAAADALAVKMIFIESYEAYKLVAYGHDNLQPVYAWYSDSRNGVIIRYRHQTVN